MPVDHFKFYSKLPRTQPGNAVFTSAYLSQVPIKITDRILEIGCSSGDRCTWIARSRGCSFMAVDREKRYESLVLQRAEEGGAGALIEVRTFQYDQVDLPNESFRAVIAEGPALEIGLEKALTSWRSLVPKGGQICLTYPGVVNKDSSAEVRGPLEARMAEPMRILPDYHKMIRANGYELQHQVPLPPVVWDAFYTDAVRHAWGLITNGDVTEQTPVIRDLLAEAQWYRTVGRGRVFLQAMVLRRLS